MKAKNVWIRGKYSIALVFFFSFFTCLNGQVFNVKEIFQEMDQWCWAGVSACVLDYYGMPTPQCEIVEYTRVVNDWHDFGSENVCVNRNAGGNYWNYNCCRAGSISDILLHFGGIADQGDAVPEHLDLVADMRARKVFIIRWGWDSGGGHFLVGHGYQEDNIYYMNPWPGEGKKVATYEWVVKGSGHTWTSTNRFATSPITPKPVLPTGDTILFKNPGTLHYSSASVKFAATYGWNLYPPEAGTVAGDDTTAIVAWNPDFTGTARLSIHGQNGSGNGLASDSLSIRVLPAASDPTLASISLNGTPVTGFNSTTYVYYLDLPHGSALPVIEAIPKNLAASVAVAGPSSIPGSALIEVVSADGAYTRIYRVYVQNATAETWSWASGTLGNSFDRGNCVHADGSGSVLATGFFRSTSIAFGSTIIHQLGSGDAWIAKYMADGELAWAKGFGGNGEDMGKGITTDGSGNILIIGDFDSPFFLAGSDTIRNSGISGTHDIFLLKLSQSGEVIWWKAFGSNHEDFGNSIVTDPQGNIYFTGMFAGREIMLGDKTLTNTGSADVLIVKLSPDGEVQWASNPAGDGDDYGNQIIVDPAGNILLTGVFGGSSLTIGSTSLANEGSVNLFLAKYNSSGQALWARQAGGYDEDYANGIAADHAGNVFITGEFSSKKISFEEQQLANTGKTDIFLAKYNPAGELLWVRKDGGSGRDRATSVQVCTDGSPVISGFFESETIDFDGIVTPNYGQTDFFITRYNTTGTAVWSKWAGGSNHDQCHSLATDSKGNLYLTGMSASPAIHLGKNTLNNNGKSTAFIAKLEGLVSGIEQRESDLPVLIYPNPSTGQVTIDVPATATGIEVLNLSGQLIQTIPLNGKTSLILELNGEGVYLIRIRAKDSLVTRKLTILRD